MNQTESKYKWIITAMCVLVLCIGLGFCSSAKNIFIVPVTKAYGFSRSAFTVNDTCRYVTVSVATIFFHSLVSKFGTKKLMLAGLLCYIVSTLLNAYSTTLIGFYLGGIFLGLAVSWSSTTMISLIINTWFDKNKGTVLGFVLASNAIGSAIATTFLTPIIYKDGNPFAYKNAYLITAFLLIIVMVIFAIFYKEKTSVGQSGNQTKKETSETNDSSGYEFSRLLRLPQFYIVLICLGFFSLTTVNNLVAPHYTDIGLDPGFVAFLLSLFSVALAASKILVGIFYDKFGIRAALNICFISSAIGKFLFFITNTTQIGKLLATGQSLLLALSTPVETVMLPIITLALFGQKSFTKTLSVVSIASTVGFCFNSPILNLAFDISGNYTFSFIFAFVISIVMLVAINLVLTSLNRKQQ